MATARFAWGIDVGNRALKAVKLVRGPEGVRIDDIEVIEHEHVLSNAGDNRETLIQAALSNFVQRHATKGAAVAVGVSGQSSFARFIKLPPVEPKKIPEIVRFEAIQQIPFPLDDVEWSYQLFQDPGSPDIEVGIFAMRKELVNQHIKYFTDAGLNVQVVQMNPLAVYNAMYYDDRIKGTTMIVDLGAENTDLIIAEGETIWLRSIPIGGNNFTEALVKNFKLKFPKAEDLKRNAATSKYGRQILQAMRPVFADLVAEIQRSIGFYASVHRDSRITRVLTLGGTFRLPGLMKYLQQNLQLEVLRIDRLGTGAPDDARLAALFNENILSSVSAYGLALQALGEAKISSSLLPQQIRRERMWREKTKWFAAAAAMVIACPAIAVGRLYYDRVQYEQQSSAREQIQKVESEARGFDSQWKEIQSRGAPDRDQIAAVKAVEQYRSVWGRFIADVGASLPIPKVKELASGDVEAIKKIPRNQRDQIFITDIVATYDDNMGPKLNLKDPEFNALANTSAPATVRPQPRVTITKGKKPPPPRIVAPTVEGPDTSGNLRGFLVTVRCTTPFANYRLLQDATAQALAKAGSNGPAPHAYKVARVTIPMAAKVNPNDTRLIAPPGKAKTAPLRAAPRTPVAGAVGAGAGAVSAAQAAKDAQVEALYQMPAPQAGGVQDVPIDPTRDMFTGEDRTGDYEVIFLLAVLLDPPAASAAGPTASAGG